MTYQEALDYIWSLVNFETKPPEQREPYKLDRMIALMARLGNPQEGLRVVHVAGTKGKGSTSAMIERVLRAAGYRTGLYTSPHLHDPRERLRMNGQPISQDAFMALVERLRSHFEVAGEATTFEALTAMAFVWFAESKVDMVVLEVGLGGRLDATNLVTPLVSVITPLALEHTAVLGNTIEEIAAEKGGIIKEGVPVVSADQPPEALAVLRQMAAERHAPFMVASERWQAVRRDISLDGQTFDAEMIFATGRTNIPACSGDVASDRTSIPGYSGDVASDRTSIAAYSGDVTTDRTAACSAEVLYKDLCLSLLGRHQIANASVAIATLQLLREQGVMWQESALREGLAQVMWPARVEVLQRKPLVIADGAHTHASAAALIRTINDIMANGWSRSMLILGISSNKDFAALLNAFEPIADFIILTRARHPRAADPVKLAAHPALATRQVQIVPKIADAMQMALAEAGPNDLIVATGSLFVAAEARSCMGRRDVYM